MAAMRISCPFCQQEFVLQEAQIPAYVGRQVPCSKCGGVFTVVSDAAGIRAIAPEAMPMAAPAPLDAPFVPMATQSNGLAVAGLVCGIAGVFTCGLTSIPGIICSILGLKKASRQQGQGKGLAIAGLCVSCFALLLVLPLMLSILLPSLARAREMANRAKCAQNLRQIGLAEIMYANDNRGRFAPDIATLASTQTLGAKALLCPSADPSLEKTVGSVKCTYIYVGHGMNASAPPDAVIAYEPLAAHGNDGMNVLWADGHVSFEPKASAQQITAAVAAGQNPPR